MKGWDLKYIQQLKEEGRIRDYRIVGTSKPQDNHQISTKKRSKEKSKLAWNLKLFCEQHDLLLVPELCFHPYRKWRFDFALLRGVTLEQVRQMEWKEENQVAAIEYNGLLSEKSRHTTITGYSGDMEKINAAQQLGWIVLQYTALNYTNVFQDLKQIL